MQPAQQRRLDQSSGWMVRRRTDETIGSQVVARDEHMAGRQWRRKTACERRFSLRDGQRTHRHQRTILAIIALLFFRTAVHAVGQDCRTARHIAGHSRHIHGRSRSQPLCSTRCCQRRSNEPSDRNDREQTTDKSTQVHRLPLHKMETLGRWTTSHVRQRGQQNLLEVNTYLQPSASSSFNVLKCIEVACSGENNVNC
jgi:hypothetical protein